MFQSLKPFIWPKYREEGPPRHVQAALLGNKVLANDLAGDPATKSVLGLMTLGYKPVTMISILRVLYDAGGTGLHGAEIGRQLEKRFDVEDGWFTRTRYYTDRVGKLLSLMVQLGILNEVVQKNDKNGRNYTRYKISSQSVESVGARLDSFSNGVQWSFFTSNNSNTALTANNGNGREKTCTGCGPGPYSSSAIYCEKCGDPLHVKCENCTRLVEASFHFCVGCGQKLSL